MLLCSNDLVVLGRLLPATLPQGVYKQSASWPFQAPVDPSHRHSCSPGKHPSRVGGFLEQKKVVASWASQCWPPCASEAAMEAPMLSASGEAALCSTVTITGKEMAHGKKEFYSPGGGAHSEHKRQTLPCHPRSREQPNNPTLQDLTREPPGKGPSGSSQPQILQPTLPGLPSKPQGHRSVTLA